MDQRSEDVLGSTLIGVRWMSIGGRSGWCHVWSDGTAIPVLSGREGDSSGGSEGDDDDGNDDDDDNEEEEEDEDDDEDDPDKIKDPQRRRAARQAAQYRTQRNAARKQRDDLKAEVTTLKASLKEAQEKGGSDETLKARVAELEKASNEKDETIKDLSGKLRTSGVERQVKDAIAELETSAKGKLTEDVDYVVWLLGRNDMLEVDEDGDVEDLFKNLKRLHKSKKLTIVSDDDEDEEDDDEDSGAASGASKKSTGKSFNGRKKAPAGLDRATLEKKYPALRRG